MRNDSRIEIAERLDIAKTSAVEILHSLNF